MPSGLDLIEARTATAGQSEGVARSHHLDEYAAAGAVAVLALAVSPPGIGLWTGRTDLSFRVLSASLALAVFLLAISAAILAQGRVRRLLFALTCMIFPVAVLAGLEFGAIAIHLADRVAPLEDTSTLKLGGRWPAHLMDIGRWQPGGRLYRPWQGPGITLNVLGLRTLPPTPKAPGEWRVAVTGGSAVWGWRVLDADTIPVQLQQLVQADNPNVTFYNFGIEGATVAQELALLKNFRDVYGIDQVIFYTGANDALKAYMDMAGAQRKALVDALTGLASFELVKAANRFGQMHSYRSPAALHALERDMLTRLPAFNGLHAGLLAADRYCNATGLRCDFLLQPILFKRSHPVGPAIRLALTYQRLYPGFSTVADEMYRDALAAAPARRIHDLSDVFGDFTRPVFTDHVHVNEAGNRVAAAHIHATIPVGPR
jgi:lysophospholipase L1-like esterase